MVWIVFPKLITEAKVLGLLLEELPEMDKMEVDRFDFMGRNAWTNDGNSERGLVYRIVAARGYVDLCNFEDAVFSYDKATKNALRRGFPYVALETGERAFSIYMEYFCTDSEDIGFAERRIEEAKDLADFAGYIIDEPDFSHQWVLPE